MSVPSTNWKKLAETAGVLAIVVGLFFVYEELRLSRTIARAEMSAASNEMLWELDALERDPVFAATLIKSNANPEDLTAIERLQLNSLLFGVLEVYFRERYVYQRGIFEEWASLMRVSAPKYFGRGYGQAYWNVYKRRLPEDVVAAVDEALKNVEWIEFEQEFDHEIVKELRQIE
jgi:hypothetical protein